MIVRVYCRQEITTASDSINRALSDRKMEIVKLCGVHHLLKKVSVQYYHALHCVVRMCVHMILGVT